MLLDFCWPQIIFMYFVKQLEIRTIILLSSFYTIIVQLVTSFHFLMLLSFTKFCAYFNSLFFLFSFLLEREWSDESLRYSFQMGLSIFFHRLCYKHFLGSFDFCLLKVSRNIDIVYGGGKVGLMGLIS